MVRCAAHLAGAVLLVVGVGVPAASPAAPPVDIDWKTLPEYMAMDRDAQRRLILHTRRLAMRQLAYTDFERAECVGALFDVTEEGHRQFYNLKGFLKKSAEERLFPDWKAQQIVAYVVKKHLCPPASGSLSSAN